MVGLRSACKFQILCGFSNAWHAFPIPRSCKHLLRLLLKNTFFGFPSRNEMQRHLSLCCPMVSSGNLAKLFGILFIVVISFGLKTSDINFAYITVNKTCIFLIEITRLNSQTIINPSISPLVTTLEEMNGPTVWTPQWHSWWRS